MDSPPLHSQSNDDFFSNIDMNWILAIVCFVIVCCVLLWILIYMYRKKCRPTRRKQKRRKRRHNRHQVIVEHTISSREENIHSARVHFEDEYNGPSYNTNLGNTDSRDRQAQYSMFHARNETSEGEEYIHNCSPGYMTDVIYEERVDSSLLEQSMLDETRLKYSSFHLVIDKQLPIKTELTDKFTDCSLVPFRPKREKTLGNFIPDSDSTFIPPRQFDNASGSCIDDILGEIYKVEGTSTNSHDVPSTNDTYLKMYGAPSIVCHSPGKNADNVTYPNESNPCEPNTVQEPPPPCSLISLTKCQLVLAIVDRYDDDDESDDSGGGGNSSYVKENDLMKMYPKQSEEIFERNSTVTERPYNNDDNINSQYIEVQDLMKMYPKQSNEMFVKNYSANKRAQQIPSETT